MPRAPKDPRTALCNYLHIKLLLVYELSLIIYGVNKDLHGWQSINAQ